MRSKQPTVLSLQLESAVQVCYQISAADLAYLPQLFSGWRRLQWRLGGMLLLGGSSLPASLLLAFCCYWPALAVGWAVLTLLVIYLHWAGRFRLRGVDANSHPPITITITSECLRTESRLRWSRWHWSVVRGIRELPNYIGLELARDNFHLIPRSAFASAEEAAQFLAEARRLKSTAGEPPFQEFTLPPDWPSEGTLALRYHNTAQELAQFAMYGLAKPAPSAEPQSSPQDVSHWFWPMASLALGALVVIFRDADDGVRLVLGTAAFAVITIATLWIVQLIQRQRMIRQLDSNQLGERFVSICPRGVYSQESLSSSFNSWAALAPLEEDAQFIVMYSVKPLVLHLIPKSAFVTESEAGRFVSLATDYQQAAAPIPAGPIIVETGNPYQPPQTQ